MPNTWEKNLMINIASGITFFQLWLKLGLMACFQNLVCSQELAEILLVEHSMDFILLYIMVPRLLQSIDNFLSMLYTLY